MHESFVLSIVLGILALLLIANLSHFITKKIGFPYSIFLVIIGAALHTFGNGIGIFDQFTLTPELLFFVFLPPLLFESAFHIDFRKLKKDALSIVTFATLGVVLTALIIATGINLLLGIPIWVSLLFASIIASTDPIAVIAIFKELGAPKRLLQMVDAESMLNDGTSIILSKVILSVMSVGFAGDNLIWTGPNFVFVFAGGIAFGGLMALLGTFIIKKVKNEMLIEMTTTVVVAYISFIVAEEFLGVSGVVSTVAAGMVTGNFGREKFSAQVKRFITEVWEYLSFIANSLVFLLVGITFGLELLITNYPAIIAAFVCVLVGRAVSVYTVGFFHNTIFSDNTIPGTWLHILNWGGLRGSLPIAIVLSLPENIAYRPELLNLTVGVVLLSLVVNGLTIKPLIKILKVDEPSLMEKAQSEITKTLLLSRSRKHIGGLKELGEISHYSDQKVDETYRKKLESVFTGLKTIGKHDRESVKRAMYQMAFQIEREVFIRLYEKGVITERILSKLKAKLDEGLDLIEAGIYPEEFSKNKVMKALSAKSKKGFSLKELFLYRKAREFANLEVLEEFAIFTDIPVLQDVYQELTTTYDKLIEKNRKMCNDLVSGDPDKIQQYEADLCYSEFAAMEASLLYDLEEKGQISKRTINVLHKAVR